MNPLMPITFFGYPSELNVNFVYVEHSGFS